MVLLTLLAGGGVTLVTQVLKKVFPSIPPMFFVGALSLLGGAVYAYLMAIGVWEAVVEHSTVAFAGAVAIYELVKNVMPASK